jgi:galactokinase
VFGTRSPPSRGGKNPLVIVSSVPSLEAAGFALPEVERRRALFRRARAALDSEGTGVRPFAWHVPGRIEVLGKHTDYAGGRSLLCATEQGFAIYARPRDDRTIRAIDATTGGARIVFLAEAASGSRGDWANYVATVARRLVQDFGPDLVGADVAFASDLPIAAGVSSSSALVIGLALALIEVNRLDLRREYRQNLQTQEELAAYLGAMENGRAFKRFGAAAGVGTLGGNQDQTAILCSRPDALVQYRFDPVAHQRTVTFSRRLSFVVAASGVSAEKAGGAIEHYNGLARATKRLADLANRAVPEVPGTLVDRLLGDATAPRRVLEAVEREVTSPEERRWLLARMAQLLEECGTLIPGLADAVEREEFDLIDDLGARSQHGAVVGLGNQIPETIALVDAARAHSALGAAAFGAGFGGSVWAIVPTALAPRFADQWRTAYLSRFPRHEAGASFTPTRPCPPAVRIEQPV